MKTQKYPPNLDQLLCAVLPDLGAIIIQFSSKWRSKISPRFRPLTICSALDLGEIIIQFFLLSEDRRYLPAPDHLLCAVLQTLGEMIGEYFLLHRIMIAHRSRSLIMCGAPNRDAIIKSIFSRNSSQECTVYTNPHPENLYKEMRGKW